MPELLEDATVEAIRIRAKWENDDYICRGHILNGMSDSLFDVYTNVESAKELWDSLESKPVMEQYNELLRILGQYTQHGLKMDESISVSSIIDKLPPSWKDYKHTLKHGKDDLSLVQLGSHLRIEESLRAHDSDKGKGKEVGGPSVNMTEEGKNKHNKQNKGKKRSNENNSGSSSNKKPKLECWKCGKTGHFKRDCRSGKKNNANAGGSGKGSKDQSQDQVDADCVDFGYYNNGMFMLNLNKVPDDSDSVYMSSSTVVNSTLWHARLGHVHYKRMLEMSKDDLIPAIDENLEKCTTCMLTKITRQPFKSITRKSVILELIHSDLCDFHATPSLGNKKYVITFIDDASRFCYVYLLHAKDEALDKFRIYKTEVELQQNDLVKTLRTDRGGEYYDPIFFQSVGIIHETTAPYTPQQNGVAERKNRALKEMVNSMLSYSGLSEGFWGEAMAVVRLPDPKRKTLGEKGIDCIFVGYAEHSKAYSIEEDPRTYNEAVQSRDAAFWKEAIDDEIGSIMENNTWVLSDLPPPLGVCKPLGCKCSSKEDEKLMEQLTNSRPRIDYSHLVDPSKRCSKTAFLNGDLDEEVYMKQPEGFVMPGNEHKVFLLGEVPFHGLLRRKTCILVFTMNPEFVAIAAAGKEAEWQKLDL
ncbi:zinc finger, CCHC-type containing protein [Tanacetum coccineum]